MKYHRIITLKNGQVAGIESIGNKYKVRHWTEFGISLIKKYWGLGIGRSLLDACIAPEPMDSRN